MTTKERKITLGSDPEVALLSSREGRIVPVCGYFGGDKGKPIPANEFGGWLEDGVALELNPVPQPTPEKAQTAVHRVLNAAMEHARKQQLEVHYPIVETEFDAATIRKHPKAAVFGCAQDFSAYFVGVPREGIMEQAMRDNGDGIRFYGGHIHLGLTDWPEALPKFVAVRLMDLLLGLPYARSYTSYPNRRDLYYGRAGLYRETSYGVEYRTLSNNWLTEDPAKPHTMKRMHEIGQLFANFEKHSARLVEIYNAVDWGTFEAAFHLKRWDDVQAALKEVLIQHATTTLSASVGVKIGDTFFPVMALRPAVSLAPAQKKPRATKKPAIPADAINLYELLANEPMVRPIQRAEDPVPWQEQLRLAVRRARKFEEREAWRAATAPHKILLHRDMRLCLTQDHEAFADTVITKLLDMAREVPGHEREEWLSVMAVSLQPVVTDLCERNYTALSGNTDYPNARARFCTQLNWFVNNVRVTVPMTYLNWARAVMIRQLRADAEGDNIG